MILFLQHISIEGPDTLGDFFVAHGLQTQSIQVYKNEPLPTDFASIQAVVVLGGPMNVYEEDRYPFLKAEDKFIKEVIARDIPFLGICLGSQLLSKACGGTVGKSPRKEVGWLPVVLNAQGRNDPLFEGLPDTIEVFQWHEDTFSIPGNGKLLAHSSGCPNQVLKVGEHAYGLQFHVEITGESIADWCDAYLKADFPPDAVRKQDMLRRYSEIKTVFDAQARTIYRNFLRQVT